MISNKAYRQHKKKGDCRPESDGNSLSIAETFSAEKAENFKG
jgi:hypothetical protein